MVSPADFKTEVKVCGVNAVHALFQRRPRDIIKAFLTEERIKPFASMLRWFAENKKAYRVVEDEELARITDSMHHEGICILARQKPTQDLDALLARLSATSGPACLVALEDVQNPHNLGAIIRVCAHYGVTDVLSLGATPSTFSTAVYRTAEGGAEFVNLVDISNTGLAFPALAKAGFHVLATSQRGDLPLYSTPLPERMVLLFGSEASGLSKQVQRQAEGTLCIGGTGTVESLNVACASTALLGEFWRQHGGSRR